MDTGIARRDILKVAAIIGGAGAIGFTTWRLSTTASALSGCSQKTSVAEGCYEPKVLNTEQFELLDLLTDLIIPEDETPGASSAGVTEFIDFYSSRDDSLATQLRAALAWFDAEARRRSATHFVKMVKQDQLALLQIVADSTVADDIYDEGRSHFSFLRQQTVLGFYSSEVGWRELSSPFLRHAYAYNDLPGYSKSE